MLPFGYDPKNYGGRIWWNENDPGMRAIWGTQADYDKHIQQGGNWKEYEDLAKERMLTLKSISEENRKQQENNIKKR